MQKLLTIVVPVYKVEQYINKCLDSCIIYKADGSLYEEKMNQLEVIIVNDGTPDNSAELSREYTVRYPQTFRQIDKENGGHGSAWNVGLKEATGKYLRFLDSDDWLTNLDKLIEKLIDCDADLVFTNESVYYEKDNLEKAVDYNWEMYELVRPITDLTPETIHNDICCLGFRPCTYKTKILQQLIPLFREGVSYDDTILYVAPLIYAQSFISYNFIVYNLLRGRDEQSMNKKVMCKKIGQLIESYDDLVKFANQHDSINQEVVKIAINSTFRHRLGIACTLPYETRKKYITQLVNMAPQGYRFSKQVNRYMKYPYVLAYLWDILREFKNTRIIEVESKLFML